MVAEDVLVQDEIMVGMVVYLIIRVVNLRPN